MPIGTLPILLTFEHLTQTPIHFLSLELHVHCVHQLQVLLGFLDGRGLDEDDGQAKVGKDVGRVLRDHAQTGGLIPLREVYRVDDLLLDLALLFGLGGILITFLRDSLLDGGVLDALQCQR